VGGGVIDVDRGWVGAVCIENVDGVCELAMPPPEKSFNVLKIPEREIMFIPGRGNRSC